MSGTPSKPPAAGSVPEYSYSFRIVHLLYVVALLASAFAVLGMLGLLLGAGVALFWAAIFARTRQTRTILRVCLAALAGICYLIASVANEERVDPRDECSHNLREIAIALSHYQHVFGEYPPAYVASKGGRPAHSWRVLILPFLEEMDLYEQYDFNEPWDGPNNSKLITRMPSSYLCPSHRGDGKGTRQYTSYVAVVGDEAGGPLRGNAMQKGAVRTAANPIMLIEDGAARITWTQPTDWNVDDALSRVTSADPIDHGPHEREDRLYRYSGGRNVAMADGSMGYFYDALGREKWLQLLTINASDTPAGADSIPKSARSRTAKVGNWLRAASFLVLAVLPLPWVFRKRGAVGAGKLPLGAEPLA